ncbi:hypothetical protein NDU88_003483 [Pleurodeles waltl]|uniref:Uncharacterized protein n=1 Tax=Pleurodeles waltl TaxID=8319 RepID=A0AAV7UCQ3_PLEWA|nr:hypothetical protein NDU88_003483 [Pleurodeles waltl]
MGRLQSVVAQTPVPTTNIVFDTLPEGPPPLMAAKLDPVLAIIEHSQVSMERHLSALATNLSFLSDDQHKLTDKATDGDKQVATLAPHHGHQPMDRPRIKGPDPPTGVQG